MPSQKGTEKHLLTKMYHFYQSNCRQTSILNTFAQGHCYWFCIGKKLPMEVKFLSQLSSPVFFYCKRSAKKMFTHRNNLMSPSPFHLPKSKSFARSMCMSSSFYTRHLIYFSGSPLWTSHVSCSTDKCISIDLSYQLFNSIPQKQSCNLDNK